MLRRILALLTILAAVPAGAGVVCSSTNKSCSSTVSSGGGGSSAFNAITSGTNTTAAMLVGTGASLGITGTGTIAASTTNIVIANEGVTGTTANYLAKLTGAPSTAIVAGTSDTSGIVGLVVSGAGTTGSATIARSGSASCAFDGATTAGNYVIVSTTAAGKCHDTGAATYPTGAVQVLGRVLSTNCAGGTYAMTLHMGTQGFQGSGTANTISKWTTGGLAQTDSGVTDDGTTVTSAEHFTVGSNAAGKNVTVNATLGSEIAPSLATGANWTSGSGWTAGDPAGIKGSDGTGTLTPASGATVTAGTSYRVTITLSAWSVGSATFTLGGSPAITTATSATTFNHYVTAGATTKLVLTPTNTSRFTISSISVKPITSTTGTLTVQGPATFGSPVGISFGSSAATPGLASLSESTLGFYRPTTGQLWLSGLLGADGQLRSSSYVVGGLGVYPHGTSRSYWDSPADVQMDALNAAGNANSGLRFARLVEVNTATKAPSALENGEVYTNSGDADGSTVTLLNDPAIGSQFCVAVDAAQTLTVAPSAGETIVQAGTAYSTSCTNNVPGSSACFLAMTGGSGARWVFLSVVGTWTCS